MYFLGAGQEVIKLAKPENVFEMLRLIVDKPGKLGLKELAKKLDVSERAIYRYMATAVSAGVMVRRYRNKGYILEGGYWLDFFTQYRGEANQSKKHLVALLTIAVRFTEDEELCERGREFLVLLGVEEQEDEGASE